MRTLFRRIYPSLPLTPPDRPTSVVAKYTNAQWAEYVLRVSDFNARCKRRAFVEGVALTLTGTLVFAGILGVWIARLAQQLPG